MEREQIPNGILIKKIGGMMKWHADMDMQRDGITHVQGHILHLLHMQEGHTATLKEMESILELAQSTVAGLVSRLEKKQLVETLRDETDRRVKRVRLTEAGLQHCESARQQTIRNEALLTSGMTESEQAEFHRLLEIACETMRNEIDQLKGGKQP